MDNYLRKCAQLCPDRVSRLFDDVSTRIKLQNAVSSVVDWRRDSAMEDVNDVFNTAEFFVIMHVSQYSLTVQSCRLWISELVKIDSCLRDYFTAVAFLHVARTNALSGQTLYQ